MVVKSRLLVILITILAGLWLMDQLTGFEVLPQTGAILQQLKATQIVSFSSLAIFSMSSVSEKLPNDNLASSQFSAWLTAFNTRDRDTILAYHEKHFLYDVASSDIRNIDREMTLSCFTGGFEIADVVDSNNDDKDNQTPHVLTVILRSKQNPHYAHASMTVDPENSSHPVTEFEIHRTHTPLKFVPDDKREEYERALAPLTPKRRRLVIAGISEVVHEQYINPAIGEEMISGLDAKVKGGEYDELTNSEEFAKRLNADARALSGDKHIMIAFVEPPPNLKNRGDDDNEDGGGDKEKECPPKLCDCLKEMNFSFDNPIIESIQTKKLGILGIKGFVSSDFTTIREAIGAIMSQIADADALIIDLRANHGGSPDTVAFIESYLLGDDGGGAVHLLDFVDRNGTIHKSLFTLPPSELTYPPNSTQHLRFGPSKPLFVLTSKDTISGGEHMAYDLQSFKRARAIISTDKATAGAAHLPNKPRFVAEEEFGKGWWFVGIPDLEPWNAVTGGNWEGVGVVSDVIVGEEEDVVNVARRMARKALGLEESFDDNVEL